MVTFALFLAAVGPPDDIGHSVQSGARGAGRATARQTHEADVTAERDRRRVEGLRSALPIEAHTAFDQVVDEYNDRLIRFAYGLLKSSDVAHDIVQDVFLRVWERRTTLRPEESFRGYLFTSVRRAALNFLKHRAVESRYASAVIHEAASPETAIEDDSEVDDIAEAVRAALASLSERRRTALHLRYEEQLPFTVIAKVMGLSDDAAQHLVRRALKELRESLGV